MPVYRPDISRLSPYQPGRPIADVARELGLDPASIVRLTSNEYPDGPFPGVAEATASMMGASNRYPDPDAWDLANALAPLLGVGSANILFGSGSTRLLADIALTVGGPGTTAIYGWPGFVMYRFVAAWAMSGVDEIPLNEDFQVDLDRMLAAVDDSTSVIFLCNPNNPTGAVRSADDVEAFARAVPERVLVVVDEAYHDFVTDDSYRTALPLALELPNLVVLRTFSKVYSLAALRIGYAVGREDVLGEIRKAQAPLSVNQAAQVAARASLGSPDELRRRMAENSAGRHHLLGMMAERSLDHVRSHTNFIFFKMPGDDSGAIAAEFTKRGVIIRPMSRGWMRVTVGAPDENARFVTVLDDVLDGSIR